MKQKHQKKSIREVLSRVDFQFVKDFSHFVQNDLGRREITICHSFIALLYERYSKKTEAIYLWSKLLEKFPFVTSKNMLFPVCPIWQLSFHF